LATPSLVEARALKAVTDKSTWYLLQLPQESTIFALTFYFNYHYYFLIK